ALAVVAFELLTGRRPFEAEHVAAQARAHVEAEPPAASEAARDLPSGVDRVLWRGLEKDPDRRWPTACAMVRALDAALGDQAEPDRTATTRAVAAAGAAPPPRTPRPRTPVPRDRPLPPRTPPPRERVAAAAPAREHRRRSGWIPVALLAVLALLVGGGAALLTGGDDGSPDRRAAKQQPTQAAKQRKERKQEASSQSAEPAAAAPAETTAPETTPTTQQPAATDELPPGQAKKAQTSTDPSVLLASGHDALLAGDYETAIADLQRAIQGCPVSTTDPCAYAYYDLGRALRLAGRPQEAIPILETRLQNPDQAETVQAELDQARAEAAEG
ncbi:MAG TPA: tetratricopeptide repeat protein, partial [Capillimicrobium sp.]|nr:tetratricopeptide repeat protein [Capillimicrobium sp.]